MERKLATVMFADLVASTELLAGQEPEITRRRVTNFFDGVARCIERHGGTVEKFAGDAVMAAFGIPRAHEDDADRAARAGFGILEHVTDLGLEARIGIEAGEVVVDETDSTFATGEAVNVAARLQQAAAPGEILIGEAGHTLTAGRIETEPARPLQGCGARNPAPGGPHRDGARRSTRASRLPQAGCRVPRASRDRWPAPAQRRHGAVHRPPVGARPPREHVCAHASGPAAAGLHDLRRTGSGEEPARTRIPCRRRGRDDPHRARAS